MVNHKGVKTHRLRMAEVKGCLGFLSESFSRCEKRTWQKRNFAVGTGICYLALRKLPLWHQKKQGFSECQVACIVVLKPSILSQAPSFSVPSPNLR